MPSHPPLGFSRVVCLRQSPTARSGYNVPSSHLFNRSIGRTRQLSPLHPSKSRLLSHSIIKSSIPPIRAPRRVLSTSPLLRAGNAATSEEADSVSTQSQEEGIANQNNTLEESTVKQLKDLLSQRGLKVSGTKNELIERLRSAPAKESSRSQDISKLLHMTVKDLKHELSTLGLPTIGLKSELVERLATVLPTHVAPPDSAIVSNEVQPPALSQSEEVADIRRSFDVDAPLNLDSDNEAIPQEQMTSTLSEAPESEADAQLESSPNHRIELFEWKDVQDLLREEKKARYDIEFKFITKKTFLKLRRALYLSKRHIEKFAAVVKNQPNRVPRRRYRVVKRLLFAAERDMKQLENEVRGNTNDIVGRTLSLTRLFFSDAWDKALRNAGDNQGVLMPLDYSTLRNFSDDERNRLIGQVIRVVYDGLNNGKQFTTRQDFDDAWEIAKRTLRRIPGYSQGSETEKRKRIRFAIREDVRDPAKWPFLQMAREQIMVLARRPFRVEVGIPPLLLQKLNRAAQYQTSDNLHKNTSNKIFDSLWSRLHLSDHIESIVPSGDDSHLVTFKNFNAAAAFVNRPDQHWLEDKVFGQIDVTWIVPNLDSSIRQALVILSRQSMEENRDYMAEMGAVIRRMDKVRVYQVQEEFRTSYRLVLRLDFEDDIHMNRFLSQKSLHYFSNPWKDRFFAMPKIPTGYVSFPSAF